MMSGCRVTPLSNGTATWNLIASYQGRLVGMDGWLAGSLSVTICIKSGSVLIEKVSTSFFILVLTTQIRME